MLVFGIGIVLILDLELNYLFKKKGGDLERQEIGDKIEFEASREN